jgi:hypothetical protein
MVGIIILSGTYVCKNVSIYIIRGVLLRQFHFLDSTSRHILIDDQERTGGTLGSVAARSKLQDRLELKNFGILLR